MPKKPKKVLVVSKKIQPKKKASPIVAIAVHHPELQHPILEVAVHDPSVLDKVMLWIKENFGSN